jgi:hypothetical protein
VGRLGVRNACFGFFLKISLLDREVMIVSVSWVWSTISIP